MDIVDTPSKDRRDWPSIDEFQEPETTLRWREIRQGIYKILKIFDHGQGRFGPSVVLELESKNVKPSSFGPHLPFFMQCASGKAQRSSAILV